MNFKLDNPGVFLKEKRKDIGYTLREISEKTGLSSGYISRIENGSSTPSLESLYKLANVLKFDIEELCSFEEVNINSMKPVSIEDLFGGFQIKIEEDILSDLTKARMVKLLKTIYKMKWNSEIDKISNIHNILMIIEGIKKGEVEENE